MEKILEIIKIKQITEELEDDRFIIRSPEDGVEYARKHIGDDDREVFFVMCLNTKNEVVAVHRAHVGSLNASVVHPRDVFKSAILNLLPISKLLLKGPSDRVGFPGFPYASEESV